MSTQADNTEKTPRRSKRNQKSKGKQSSLSQTPSKFPFSNSHDVSNVPFTQSAPIGPIANPAIAVDTAEHPNVALTLPSTPPQAYPTRSSFTTKDHMSNESVSGATNRGDCSNRPQNARRKASPQSSRGGTPSTTSRPNTLASGRASETPSKAYAGPTFHASPAASSLPMPKFFSKSMPNVDKTSTLKQMMESEATDTASENEESPFVDSMKSSLGRQAREESPLDIFFQADRKAKAGTSSSSLTIANPGGLSPYDSLRSDASPSRGSSRHHSRHPTDSSIGGVFDLEMGSPAQKTAESLPFKAQPPAYDRSISAPSNGVAEEQATEDQRQASTAALKKMLLLPQVQRPGGTNSDSEHITAAFGSPSSKPRQQLLSSPRGESRPASSPGLASDVSRVQRQAALRALAEKQIPSTNGPLIQRPPTSSLRKEMTMPKSPGQYGPLELPGTPTPTRMQGSSPAANTRSQTRNRQDASERGNVPISGLQNLSLNSKQQREVAPSGPSPTTVAIENDLRRILKMDVLGNDGASGVSS